MAGEAFAALLTENAAEAKSLLAGEIDEALASLDLVHINYYRGTRLLPWTALEGHAALTAKADEPTDATPTDATPTDATPTDATPTDAEPKASLGDVDGDGEITSGDARLALRRSVQLESYAEGSLPFLACDIDRDGTVTSGDARIILRISVSLEHVADYQCPFRFPQKTKRKYLIIDSGTRKSPAVFWRARHGQRLGGGSPLQTWQKELSAKGKGHHHKF